MKNQIEQRRRAMGMTQQALAQALGVSRQTVISLENGRYNPSLLLAYRLAQLFHEPIESLFSFEEEETL